MKLWYIIENSMTKNEFLKVLSIEEKIRLLNGVGSWKTFSADGKIPQIVMSDGPHGLRKQTDENYSDINVSKVATCYPTASCMASSWNRDALSKLGKAIAQDALRENVNVVLGCAMNIKRSPLCGRNFEYFSEDPFLTGELAASYVNGLQKDGPGACIKHFACNNQEKNRQTSSSNMDERTLREIYLSAFETVVKKANPACVMTSYNKVNGTYASASSHLITDILRNEWGFRGITISDWGACMDAAACLKAGLDLAMPDSYGYFQQNLKTALEEGRISENDIDTAVLRILDKVLSLQQDTSKTYADNYLERHDIAHSLACESAVLLKNEGALPVKRGMPLCVIGELAKKIRFQGGGSSHITTREYPDVVRSLEQAGYKVNYSAGYYSGFCPKRKLKRKNKPLQQAALDMARIAAVKNIPIIFFCGLTESYEGEGFDRTTLDLPCEQMELLNQILEQTNNVIVVNFSGAPVKMDFVSKVKAVLHMYLGGEAVGEALADIISGKVNPSGHLSETWPAKLETVPCIKNFATEELNVNYDEGVFVGYRHYESKNIPVLFEFGYGLSYTKFKYSELAISGKTVSCKIENRGEYDGAEVVQLYIRNDGDGTLRPVTELKGFEKVFLKAGESATVTFNLDDRCFSVYSEIKGEFAVVEGDYTICIGSSIKDIRLSGQILVNGEKLNKLVRACDVTQAFNHNAVESHVKGNYTVQDSLCKMAEESFYVRNLIIILKLIMRIVFRNKSMEDPSVKIMISALTENPVESLIGVSNGIIKEKYIKHVVNKANHGFE